MNIRRAHIGTQHTPDLALQNIPHNHHHAQTTTFPAGKIRRLCQLRPLSQPSVGADSVPVVQWIEQGFPSRVVEEVLNTLKIEASDIVKRLETSPTGATFGATNFNPFMATVRRVPRSPYWIAKFRNGDTVTYRSTKQKNRSDALSIALEWERQARDAHKGEMTQSTVLKFANELLARVGQDSVGKVSTQTFATEWLTKGIKADSTRRRYESVITGFLSFLGPARTKASIGSVTADEIEKFRDKELSQGKKASTADFGVKVLRAMFESARKKNQRLDNPADAVEAIPVNQQERRSFSDTEISLLLSKAGSEWQGMIILGAFAGLRLNDAANIRWDQIDLRNESLTFMPAKTAIRTAKRITLALHPMLVEYLKRQSSNRSQNDVLFPSLAGKKSGSAGGLSNQFAGLLVSTGLREKPIPAEAKKQISRGRAFNALGFHSTRHYFISKLANADVPTDVRKALAGHSEDSAHSKYTHLEVATQRRAIQQLKWDLPLPKPPDCK